MTPLLQQILERCQVRKSQTQKDAFIALLRGSFPELRVEEGGMLRGRNLILGDGGLGPGGLYRPLRHLCRAALRLTELLKNEQTPCKTLTLQGVCVCFIKIERLHNRQAVRP